MAVLPADIDFVLNPAASPARMNQATASLDARLRALELPARTFDQVLAGLQTIGLERINDALQPYYQQLAAAVAAYTALVEAQAIDGGTFAAPAARIRLRRSTIAGEVPALLDGETAINEADGLLYWRDAQALVHSTSLLDTITAAILQPLLDAKSDLDSPVLTGMPTAPTPAAGAINDQLATAAFVAGAVAHRLSIDAPQAVTSVQQVQAFSNLGIVPQVGQCRFEFVNATQCVLNPYNGNKLFIAGAYYTILAGTVLANTGLPAQTVLYVYAYIANGAIALETSSIGHVNDPTFGHKIKNGDSSRTLVGMVAPNGSTQFRNDFTYQGVRSWFNRIPIHGVGYPSGYSPETGSTSPVGLWNTVYFIAWADEVIDISMIGSVYNKSAYGCSVANYIFYDGASQLSCCNSLDPNWQEPFNISGSYFVTEAVLHTVAPYGNTDGGDVIWNYSCATFVRS